jgi:hypothetical protein
MKSFHIVFLIVFVCQILIVYFALTAKIGDVFSENHYGIHDGKKLTIVTAATPSFFNALQNLIGSIHYFCSKKCEIAVFSLNLNTNQIFDLQTHAKVRVFWANTPWNEDANTYSFKPIAIREALNVFQHVLWLDAGSTVTGDIYSAVMPILEREGHFFVQGQDLNSSPWIYEGMLKHYGFSREFFKNKPSYSGNTVGFTQNSANILDLWVACASDANCIAPSGHSKQNHRYDQASLTVLLFTQFPNVVAHTELLAAQADQLRGCMHASEKVVWTSRSSETCYVRFFSRLKGRFQPSLHS